MNTSKASVISAHQMHESDTGSAPVQIALLTNRIQKTTQHLQMNRKDFHSRRGLIRMVSERKRLLSYLQKVDKQKFDAIIQQLGIRG